MLLRAVYSSARMRSSSHAARPPITAYAVFPCGSHPTVRTHAGGGETLLFPCACVASCGPSSFAPVAQCVATRSFTKQTLSFTATLFPPVPAHTVRAYSTADSSLGAESTAAAGVDWSGVELLRVLAHLNAPGSPQGPSSPAVKTEGDVAEFIAWAKALPPMQSNDRPGGGGARFISPFKNWSDAMLAAHAEALVRAQFAPGAFPKHIEEFLTRTKESERNESFWNLQLLPFVYHCLPYHCPLQPRTLASIVESGSNTWKDFCKLDVTKEENQWCNRVLVLPSLEDPSPGATQLNKSWKGLCDRQVVVPKACAATHAALSVVAGESTSNILVVTGESGAGKSFSTVMRAASSSELTSSYVLYFPVCAAEIPSRKTDETDEQYRPRRDDAVFKYLVESVQAAIGENLPKDDNATAYVIIDEMDSQPDALRAVCRLALPEAAGAAAADKANSAGSSWGSLLIRRLADIVGCTVRIIAIATGCHSEYFAAGSMGVDPPVSILTPAFGEQVWRELFAAEVEKHEKSRIWVEACRAVAPALVPEEWKHTKRLTPAPWGRFGTALVRNPRIAALILRSIMDQIALQDVDNLALTHHEDAWEARADVIAGMAIGTAVSKFARLNGLRLLTPPVRVGFVAAAVALHLNATDADLPNRFYRRLCAETGVVILYTTELAGGELPERAREVKTELSGGPRLCVEPTNSAGLGPGGLRLRYRVTPAHVTMMTLGFGFAPRPPNEGLEAALLDYCVVAVTAADVLWQWAVGKRADLWPLVTKRAPAEDVPRNGLFEAIRATMLFGAGQGTGPTPEVRARTEGRIFVRRGRSPKPFQPTVAVSADPSRRPDPSGSRPSNITDWHKSMLRNGKEDEPGRIQHVCLLNAPAASGPDLAVLLPGAGAVLMQAKDNQTYTFERLRSDGAQRIVARLVVETLNEFVKMGAPAFDKRSVLECCDSLDGKPLDEEAVGYIESMLETGALCVHRKRATRGWDAVSSKDFPFKTFVVVRAFGRDDKTDAASSPVQNIVNKILACHHKNCHDKNGSVVRSAFKCVYVETYNGDPLFDPVDVAARDDGSFQADFESDIGKLL